MNTNRSVDYRQQWLLNKGDTIKCEGEVYTITGEPIGFGGSSVLYPATQEGSYLEYCIKECFPRKPERFIRKDGVVRPQYADDEIGRKYLDQYAAILETEKEWGQKIRNTSTRAIGIWKQINPESITANGHLYTDVSDGIFSVIERMDKKGLFFNEFLSAISKATPMKEYRRTKGLPNIHTTASMLEQVLLALDRVHEAGFLFGDIQGANVFFSECNPQTGEAGIGHLLDFGSTRRLCSDGYTEPIEAGFAYSTDGFRPPEIRDQNGNALRLGKSADVYSVGCLMLRCVVSPRKVDMYGDSPDVGRDCLDPIDAKAIGCNTRVRMLVNRILAKATAVDPNMRYANAATMLSDIRHLKDCSAPVLSWENGITSDVLACAAEKRYPEMNNFDVAISDKENVEYISAISDGEQPPILFYDEMGNCLSLQELFSGSVNGENYRVSEYQLPGREHLLYYFIRTWMFDKKLVPIYLKTEGLPGGLSVQGIATLVAKQYLNNTSQDVITAVAAVLTSNQEHRLLCLLDSGDAWTHIVTPIASPIILRKLICKCGEETAIEQFANRLIAKKLYLAASEWLDVARSMGSAIATDQLGQLYLCGLGVEHDPGKAWDLFTEATEKAHGSKASAYKHLGDMWMESKHDPQHIIRKNPFYAWLHYNEAQRLGFVGLDKIIEIAKQETDLQLSTLLDADTLEQMGSFFMEPSDYRCNHIKNAYYSKITNMLDNGDSVEWVAKVHGLTVQELERVIQCNKIAEYKEHGYSAEAISKKLNISVDMVYYEIAGIMSTLKSLGVRLI